MQPPRTGQSRSARPKSRRQRPKTLQRCLHHLRRNLDWVKLEPAASCEPPRHQRRRGAKDASSCIHYTDPRAHVLLKETRQRPAEADRTPRVGHHIPKGVVRNRPASRPIEAPSSAEADDQLPKSKSSVPPPERQCPTAWTAGQPEHCNAPPNEGATMGLLPKGSQANAPTTIPQAERPRHRLARDSPSHDRQLQGISPLTSPY
jgi:hypothetical protein